MASGRVESEPGGASLSKRKRKNIHCSKNDMFGVHESKLLIKASSNQFSSN